VAMMSSFILRDFAARRNTHLPAQRPPVRR
jgi:hypothetical protein